MKLRIPPALLVIIFGGLMYALDRYLPVGEFDFFGRRILMYFLAGLAIVIMFLALFRFMKARTTVNSDSPSDTSNLVTGGIYRFTRNPMYLSMLLWLLAWGLGLGNAFNTLTAALFVAYMNRFQIKPEEEALKQLFGKEYEAYCAQVRRWF